MTASMKSRDLLVTRMLVGWTQKSSVPGNLGYFRRPIAGRLAKPVLQKAFISSNASC